MNLLSQSSSSWSGIYDAVRLFFLAFDAALVFIFVTAFLRAMPYRPKIHPEHGTVKKNYTLADDALKRRWEAVRAKLLDGSLDSAKLAVIEADKIVDDALKRMGFEGKHMADRLEQLSSDELRSLERLWRSHRIRNNLVHAPGFSISPAGAKSAVDDFEAFLKEIKMLA